MIHRVCTVIGTLRWVKCPSGYGERGTPWNMEKSTVNHHKAHKSLQRPGNWRSSAGVPVPGWRRGAAVAHRLGAPRVLRRLRLAPPGALNWSLRRYVRPSSLRVWLMRRAAGAGCANALAGESGPLCDVGRQAARPARRVRCCRAPAVGGSRPGSDALPGRVSRNRQTEHSVQVAASLRGGVRLGSAITLREHLGPGSSVSATISNRSCA